MPDPQHIVDRLNQTHGQGDAVRFDVGEGGLIRLNLANTHGEAQIYLHGAHVTHYRPANEEPVLFMSRRSRFEAGAPIRGGVPVCFPWFGAHATDADAPMHGFARLKPWKLREVRHEDLALHAELVLEDSPATHAAFGHRFEATLGVTLGPMGLVLTLTVAHRGEPDAAAMTYEAALHSYFAVDDARQVTIHGLEGARYLDKVHDDEVVQPDQPIRIEGETDRLYVDTVAACRLEDPVLHRAITVSKTGSRTTVVWNPWADKAQRMPDFGDDEWPGMVCIETANARRNAVTLSPGASHTMTASIEVTPL